MSSNTEFVVLIFTGNRKYSGTDSSVHIILHGDDGTASKPIGLSHFFTNNFETEKIDAFHLRDVENLHRFVNIERLELWKDKTFGIISDDWYVDKIVVINNATHDSFDFPIFRWITSENHYNFKHLDVSLPQFDEFPEQRKMELETKKKTYQYDQKFPNGPVQIKNLPRDERFANDYKWDLVKLKAKLKYVNWWTKLWSPKKWNCLSDIDGIYGDGKTFYKPRGAHRWDCDIEFGRQRMASINPAIIALLTTIPDKFPVTDDLLKQLLEGLTLQDAITQKRLFLCDLRILEGIPVLPNMTICKPLALFFVDSKQQLRPVAIQLFQEPGPDNPIFTPLDEPMLWKLVKMWYNNADCCHHQAITHLGLTHLIMEGVVISVHRNLSPSHPVFKLLAPHFLYLIAINSRALAFLVSPGGWVDKTMAYGHKGLLALTIKGLGEWRMNVNGLLPEDLKARGLDDPNVLPGYYYRDDGLLIFNAIKKYVTSYVGLYYTTKDMIKDDAEIQAWAQELVMEGNECQGGVGIKGVPGNGSIESSEDLVTIITSIIYTCSAGHASANFGQYDEYASFLRYPTTLIGKPPSSKDAVITERDILNSVVSRDAMRDILVVAFLLSSKGTNSIGDFEVQYIFDPRAIGIIKEFREDLKKISEKITARNEQLEVPYEYLIPMQIPNSISI